jgi:hypothetical protein
MNWSAVTAAEVPPGVVTVTSTVPAVSAGEVVVMLVSLTTVKVSAVVSPKLTTPALVKPVPVIVTAVPPASGPAAGATPVTTGSGKVYVKRSAERLAEGPPAVVTVTSTVPAEPAGAVALMRVALTTVNEVAALLPKLTAVAPVNAVPVTVTTVPPATGPEMGEILVTVGATV